MFKLALTTAFVAVSLSLAMAGGASASPEDDFRDRCVAAGGTFTDGACKYPDGSTEHCQFGEDDWACYRDEPKPVLFKNFGKLINVPVKIVKTPIPPGPVEIEMSSKVQKVRPSMSAKSESFTTQSMTVAPSAKLDFSPKVTTLKFKR